MLGLCEMLFIAGKQFLSFRLISDSEEENNGQRRKVLVSKNGGSSSSDHPKPLLKQNGVIIDLQSCFISAFPILRTKFG